MAALGQPDQAVELIRQPLLTDPRHASWCYPGAVVSMLGWSAWARDLNAGITDPEPFAWACRVLAKDAEPFELFYPHGHFLVKQ